MELSREKNRAFVTYAVSLHFSQDVNEIISDAVSTIAGMTGDDFIIQNKVPPHVTIGAFHGMKENEERLMQIVEAFSNTQRSGVVRFTELGSFNGKVLFLKPEKDAYLSEINKALHNVVLPEFEKGENGYYLPEVWVPHATLATRLHQSQLDTAMEIAGKISLPLEAAISNIGVYQCAPFLELKRFPVAMH